MTALADGVQGADRLTAPIKFVWQYAGNALINQHGDTNRTAKILEDTSKCEMIVVIDNQMTPSCRYADIILPDASNAEQEDLIQQGAAGPLGYAIFARRPSSRCSNRRHLRYVRRRRQTLGVGQTFTEGDARRVAAIRVAAREKASPACRASRSLPGWAYAASRTHRITRWSRWRVSVRTRRTGGRHPLGKIEIFSKKLWDLNRTWQLPKGEQIAALPAWYDYPEGVTDPLIHKYPLQAIGHHYKGRTHSTYGNVAWLQEAAPQVVWINPSDAALRGIANDDTVHVFNDRGRIKITARVTERIAPGVVSVPEGAWYMPGAQNVDTGGCVNTLTSQHPTPLAKGNGQHTILVQVEMA